MKNFVLIQKRENYRKLKRVELEFDLFYEREINICKRVFYHRRFEKVAAQI